MRRFCFHFAVMLTMMLSSTALAEMNDLYMVILRDPDAQVIALENNKVDVLGEIIRPVDIERLSKSQNIELSIAPAFHAFYVSFNLRKEPWNIIELRRAAWQVIQKDKIVRDLFSGYAEPISSFLPPISTWINNDITTLSYDPEAARKMLKDAGWTWDKSGFLVMPDGRPVPPQKLMCPTASVAPTSAEIANLIADAFHSLGIPIASDPMDFSTMLAKLDRHEFDVVVHAWSLTRDPDSLYMFFHSDLNVPGGYNISGISDVELDKVLLSLRDAPDEASARAASDKAQQLLASLVPEIPIYSRYSIAAIQKSWNGIYFSERTTVDNFWTLLGMTPTDGKERPVYWALTDEPRSLSPLTSRSAYDWMVLGNIYDTLISVNPETLEDIPWLADEWKVETVDGKTELTFVLHDGIKWQDGEPLTVDDVIYTLKFLKDNEIPRYYDSVKDIVTVDSPKSNVIHIKLSKSSYWHLHNIGGLPVLPKHIIKHVKNWQTWQPVNEKHPSLQHMTQLIGSGAFAFSEYRTGEYVHLTKNKYFREFWTPQK